MAQKEKKVTPRPKDYEKFRAPIERILKRAKEPLTWAEIKEKSRL